MKAWTDYPFTWLGDTSGEKAPVREIEVLSYDDNKYCRIKVCDGEDEIKAGYIYQREGRYGEAPKASGLIVLAHNANRRAEVVTALQLLMSKD